MNNMNDHVPYDQVYCCIIIISLVGLLVRASFHRFINNDIGFLGRNQTLEDASSSFIDARVTITITTIIIPLIVVIRCFQPNVIWHICGAQSGTHQICLIILAHHGMVPLVIIHE